MVSKLVPFLMLPFLTEKLEPAEFAVIALFQALYSLNLSLLGNVQANVAPGYVNDLENFPSIMGGAVLFLFLALVSSFGLQAAALWVNPELIDLKTEWVLLVPIVAFAGGINLLNLAVIRVREAPFEYMAWEVLLAVANITLTFVLMYSLSFGWEGRVLGIFLPIILSSVLASLVLYFQGFITFKAIRKQLARIANISLPMIPHGVAAVLIMLADTFMISKMLGANELGIYSIAYQFGMVLLILTDAFLKAWQPKFYRYIRDGNKTIIFKVQLLFFVGLPIVAALYSIFIYMALPAIVSESYWAAREIILIVVVAYVFYGYYQIIFPYLIVAQRTRSLAIITPLCAIVNVVLNYYLLPVFGVMGAAYATVVSYILLFFVLSFYTRYYLKGQV